MALITYFFLLHIVFYIIVSKLKTNEETLILRNIRYKDLYFEEKWNLDSYIVIIK